MSFPRGASCSLMFSFKSFMYESSSLCKQQDRKLQGLLLMVNLTDWGFGLEKTVSVDAYSEWRFFNAASDIPVAL